MSRHDVAVNALAEIGVAASNVEPDNLFNQNTIRVRVHDARHADPRDVLKAINLERQTRGHPPMEFERWMRRTIEKNEALGIYTHRLYFRLWGYEP